MYVIRTLNSVYLSLFLDMSPHTLDPRCPLVNKMSLHIYTCKWHLGSGVGGGGNRVVEVKQDNIQLKTLTSGSKYTVSKYTVASTVQILKSLVVGVVEQLFTLLYRCFTHV